MRAAESTETVSLNWSRESLQTDKVIISGPIGLGAIALTRHGTEVSWQDGQQQRPISELPVDAVARKAASQLPVDRLGNWLLGYATDTPDWVVAVDQWQAKGGWRLPRVMTLNSDGLRIRLVLLDWQLGDGS